MREDTKELENQYGFTIQIIGNHTGINLKESKSKNINILCLSF